MIELVLVKKDILRYVQDVGTVRGMGRGFSDHHVIMCKVRLVNAWIKRREVVSGVERIRNEKLKEQQYVKGSARCLETKRVELDLGRNFEQMWEQVERAMINSVGEVLGSVRGGGMEKHKKINSGMV